MIIPTSFFSSIIVTPTEFDANSIVGLEIWLKGNTSVFSDAGTTLAVNSDPAYQWNDQSENGNHLVQSTLGNRPIFKTSILNGKPVIRFDATDDYMDRTYSSALSQPSTIFVVVNITTDNQGSIFDGVGCASRNIFGPNTVFFGETSIYAGNVNSPGYAQTFPSGFIVFSLVFNNASSEIFKNGISQIIGDVGSEAADSIRVGANCVPNTFSGSDIAEIIVYNSLLTANERLQVETYLNAKYAIY